MLKKIIITALIITISNTVFAENKEVEVRLLGFVETSLNKDYDFFKEDNVLGSNYRTHWIWRSLWC